MSKVIATISIPKDAITHRNAAMKWVAENDPTRFRTRKVRPHKGKGRKSRPRNSNRSLRIEGD